MAHQHVVTDKHSGATYSIQVGDELTVELTESPTTGYCWELLTGPHLDALDDDFVHPSTTAPGAGGVHRFRLVATREGTDKISAILVRPWSRDDVASAFDLRLVIRRKSAGGVAVHDSPDRNRVDARVDRSDTSQTDH